LLGQVRVALVGPGDRSEAWAWILRRLLNQLDDVLSA
jgi:hypothetical protein